MIELNELKEFDLTKLPGVEVDSSLSFPDLVFDDLDFDLNNLEEDLFSENIDLPQPENTIIESKELNETINTLNGRGINSLLNEIILNDSETKKYNTVKEHDEKRIMELLGENNESFDKIQSILKMNEAYVENLSFYINLRKIIDKYPIKSKVMDLLGIRKSYTGFHDFLKEQRPDLPDVGLNSIAKKLGYSIALVPIKLSDTDDLVEVKQRQELIESLQTKFVNDIDDILYQNLKDDLNKKKPQKKEKTPEQKNIMDFMEEETNIDGILDTLDINSVSINLEDFEIELEEDDFEEEFGGVFDETYGLTPNIDINDIFLDEKNK